MKYKIIERQVLEGIVTAVHDGDSIKVVFPGETVWVRLYGCDAPEVVSNHVTANQPHGAASGAFLRSLLKGKRVTVETLFKDIFNRMICKVSIDGSDVTEIMLEAGQAWWLSEPKMNTETKIKIRALHDSAKSSGKGFWAVAGRKVRPSTWRKDHRRFSTTKLYEDLW